MEKAAQVKASELPVSAYGKPVLAGVLLLAALVGAVPIDGGFVYDDRRALLESPVVAGELPIYAAFTHDFWGGPLSDSIRSYRPLLPALWNVLWELAPLKPLPFRVLSCVLHVFSTLAMWLACSRLLPRPSAAFVAAALFAVHPVHAEAIGGIVSQSDVASAALGALALAVGVGSTRNALLGALLVLLACSAKESAVVFGLALLARVWASRAPGKPLPWLDYAPLIAVCGVIVATQLSFERTPGGVMPESLARSLAGGMRALYGLHVIGHGTRLLIAPTGLAPHHGYAAVEPTLASLGPYAAFGACALAAALWVLVRALRKRDGALLVGLCLWLGPLLIQSGFFVTPVTDVVERLLYTPSIAACGLYGAFLVLALPSLRVRGAMVGAVVLVLLGLSIQAERAWVSDYALAQRAEHNEPRSWQNQKNWAAQLTQAGAVEEAAWHFLLSLHFVRSYPRPIAWSRIEELGALPLHERLVTGPFVLEPERACELAREYLKNMRNSAPQLVLALAPLYARRCT